MAKKIIFSDEVHFNLGGHVNKQNGRIWGTENPHAYIEKPTHLKRITVRCGFWSRGIIGSFFFQIKEGEAVTVNSDRYRSMLNEFMFTRIEEEDISNIWFQQDGVTGHTAEATLDVLRPVFEDWIISCDLTSLDTIDNVLKKLDRSCRQLHDQPRQLLEWNYLPFLHT